MSPTHTTRTSPDPAHDASIDIVHEFKSFVSDIETMVKETASLTGDELAQAKIKINQRIMAAKQCINNASDTMAQQAWSAGIRTNEYAHEEPWAVIGTSAFVSFVLGLLLGNRHEKSAK